jgi:glycogen(starch) synthase
MSVWRVDFTKIYIMKIVIASYTFLPSIGGVATNVSVLAKAFSDLKHDVTVITTETINTPVNYKVERNPSPLLLLKYYRHADILILSNLSLKLIWPLLIQNSAFALLHHSEAAWNLPNSLIGHIKKKVRDNGIHFMTSNYCGKQGGLPYTVTYPSANPHYINESVILPHIQRNGVLFVGRFEKEKGVIFLLEKWAHISSTLGERTLHIVGTRSMVTHIRKYIEKHPNLGITFHGRSSLKDTAEIMGKSAFSIIPSLWEEPF